ncbi:VapE domain-containing protein [Paracoccus nototheniae]|uniref:VapE domain-containing protein n=1 Tax=Paracoccus nototheniae TaxID=2489002 RepID=A0ABW4DXM9_9RHOB|nr:VapE domain-containing protein [Paracoccus nototheniae]
MKDTLQSGSVQDPYNLDDLLAITPPLRTNLDVALSLASRGLAVCPVRDWGDGDGWKPIAAFPTRATADATTIRSWWRQWPESRVALITGERNGISVLDVDVKNGKDGLASLNQLGFPDIHVMSPVRSGSPSGGWHVFLKYKPGLKATVGQIGPGLDVRNNGGFVIAPDSLKDGKRYVVHGLDLTRDTVLPEWPQALTPPAKPDRGAVEVREASPSHMEWARGELDAHAARVADAGEGTRQSALNNASMWAGGVGAHGALTRDQAEELLVAAGLTCGLSDREARSTFAHGWSDGLAKPIALPFAVDASDFDDLPAIGHGIEDKTIQVTGFGAPKATMHNAICYLQQVNAAKGFGLRHNAMTGRDEWQGGLIQESDLTLFRVAIEQAGMHNVGGMTAEAVRAVAQMNQFHPIKDWLAVLAHDGEMRLDTWLTRYLGVADSPYVRAVGRAFLIAMVARVMRPGCKHDHVLVLAGPQGIGKSTACRIVGGEWTGDNMPSIREGAKEAGLYLRGHWLVELAELAPSRKAEAEDLKSFLTRGDDEIRAPYARRADIVPRQTVFIGTTNEAAFLRDMTGGRRFWPVTCGDMLDTIGLARDRDQLFAEAVAAFTAGERWHLSSETERLAWAEQESVREEDPWESAIADHLDGDDGQDGFDEPVDKITARDLLIRIGVPIERQKQADLQRISRILKHRGWIRQHSRNGKVWVRQCNRIEL